MELNRIEDSMSVNNECFELVVGGLNGVLHPPFSFLFCFFKFA